MKQLIVQCIIPVVVVAAVYFAIGYTIASDTNQCPEPACSFKMETNEEGCLKVFDADLRPWNDIWQEVAEDCRKCYLERDR